MRSFSVLAVLVFSSGIATAQHPQRVGARPLLPRAQEIPLARSAAPAAVSAHARVYVLEERGYVMADSGTGGVACYVSRSWRESLEPHCFDEEGARTIMRMEMRQVELLHAGRTEAEADAEIAQGIAGGTFPLPSRPAMSWMMSPDQVLYSDDGRRVGNWRPHLMIYYPYLTDHGLGLAGAPDPSHGYVEKSGEPRSTIIVVVPAFTSAAAAARSPD
jgi:hypothetical protein